VTAHITGATDKFGSLDNSCPKSTHRVRTGEPCDERVLNVHGASGDPQNPNELEQIKGRNPNELEQITDRLLRVQHRVARSKSRSLCGLVPVDSNTVLWTSRGFAGVLRCNASTCAYCGRYKARERSEVLYRAMKQDNSSDYYMLTLTVPTDTTIKEQLSSLKRAISRFTTNNRQYWKRKGLTSSIARSYDVTFDPGSRRTHLHIHAIMSLTSGISEADVSDRCWNSWKSINEKQGRTVVKSAFYCKRVKHIRTSSLYLSKSLGYEVMSSATKKGFNGKFSLNGLLGYIDKSGCRRSIKMYQDFEAATYGLRFVSLPRHFKDMAELNCDIESGQHELEKGQGNPSDLHQFVSNPAAEHVTSGIESGYRFPHISVRRDVHLQMYRAGASEKVLSILLYGDAVAVERLRCVVEHLNDSTAQTSPDTASHLHYFWANWKSF